MAVATINDTPRSRLHPKRHAILYFFNSFSQYSHLQLLPAESHKMTSRLPNIDLWVE